MSAICSSAMRASRLQALDVLVGRVEHQVDLARGQRGQPRGVALHGDEADLLQVAVRAVGPAPPARVARSTVRTSGS
jgi:hypothetical protein